MQALLKPQAVTREDTFLAHAKCKPMEQELRVMSEAKKAALLNDLKKLAEEYKIKI